MDLVHFEQLVMGLMDPSNQIRSQAEKTYNDAKAQPDILISLLLQSICQSQVEQIREMSNVLLRRAVGRSSESLWGKLQPQTQQLVKTQLLIALNSEPNPQVRVKLCDGIGELGGVLIERNEWNELLEVLFRLTKSESEIHRHGALQIFGSLASIAGENLRQHLNVLHQIFAEGLHDPSPKVSVAALTATANFLQSLEPAEKQKFQQLIPAMLGTISTALNANKEEEAREALELFVDIAGLDALFFKSSLESVLSAMFSIATHTKLEDSTRQLAIEFLVTLAESRPGMIRKIPKFCETLIPIVLNLMIDLEDDPEWGQSSEEDEIEITNSDVGEEVLDRLALALGGKTMVPVLFGMLSQLLTNSDWKHRHAALMAISVVGEGCNKYLTPHLKQVLDTIIPFLQDPHPRVRWATCNTLGQMSTDFGPTLQNNFHNTVLPALMSEMDDVQNPRVQSHAAAAVINFCEHCTSEILNPYLDMLLSKLVNILQRGKMIAQEQAITAIAAVADAAEEYFDKYYPTLMPMLKQILFNANTKELRMLRGKAIECISLIAVAVGKEKFAPDAKEVIEIMLATQNSITEADDPQTSFLLQSWARICRCLKEDFVPFLPHVMPSTLKSAKLDPDVTISETEQEETDGWEFINIGDKVVGIHTSSLEEKSTACNMLYCYAAELGEGFFPYVEEVARVLVPLTKFYYHDGVRSAAVSTLPFLLGSASEALKKNGAQGADKKYVVQLFHFMIGPLLDAVAEENDQEILLSMVETIAESISYLPEGGLSQELAKQIIDTSIGLLRDLFDRRTERAAKQREEDYDAEEEEKIEEEDTHDDEILSSLQEIFGNIAKITKPFYLGLFQEYLPLFLGLIKEQNKPSDRQVALCVFDDLIEHIGKDAFPYVQDFFPYILTYIGDKDAAVRQAAVYGIGVAVEKDGSYFATAISNIFNRLKAIISSNDSRSEEYILATENAISAAGKLINSGFLDKSQTLPLWLSWLPTTEDKIESKPIYRLFCQFVISDNAIVFGQNFENLPRILQIVGTAIGSDLVDEEINTQLLNVLKQMQTSFPSNILQQSFATLPKELQEKLQKVLQ